MLLEPARAASQDHRCCIHLLVFKLGAEQPYFALIIARALSVQVPQLAARDYDALSGFESKSSD